MTDLETNRQNTKRTCCLADTEYDKKGYVIRSNSCASDWNPYSNDSDSCDQSQTVRDYCNTNYTGSEKDDGPQCDTYCSVKQKNGKIRKYDINHWCYEAALNCWKNKKCNVNPQEEISGVNKFITYIDNGTSDDKTKRQLCEVARNRNDSDKINECQKYCNFSGLLRNCDNCKNGEKHWCSDFIRAECKNIVNQREKERCVFSNASYKKDIKLESLGKCSTANSDDANNCLKFCNDGKKFNDKEHWCSVYAPYICGNYDDVEIGSGQEKRNISDSSLSICKNVPHIQRYSCQNGICAPKKQSDAYGFWSDNCGYNCAEEADLKNVCMNSDNYDKIDDNLCDKFCSDEGNNGKIRNDDKNHWCNKALLNYCEKNPTFFKCPNKKYSCVGGKCVFDKNGNYDNSNCDGKCASKKYSCVDGKCTVKDGGEYDDSDCDGKCAAKKDDSNLNNWSVMKKASVALILISILIIIIFLLKTRKG